MADEELIERLLLSASQSETGRNLAGTPQTCRQAAARLQELTAEVERLREALATISDPYDCCPFVALGDGQYADPACIIKSRAALQPQEKVG